MILRPVLPLFVTASIFLLAAFTQAEETVPSLTTTAQKEFEALEVKMGAVFGELNASLNEDEQATLAKLQEQWVAYRTSAAETTALLSSPTDQHRPLIQWIESAKLTEERIAALTRILQARQIPLKESP